MRGHSLECAIQGPCLHEMEEIPFCVICGAALEPQRDRVDTCSSHCRQRLMFMRRTAPSSS